MTLVLANFTAWENEGDVALMRFEWRPDVKEHGAEGYEGTPEFLDTGQLVRRKYDDILLMWGNDEHVAYCNIEDAEDVIRANSPEDFEFITVD